MSRQGKDYYDAAYFQNQVAKSDAKVVWEGQRLVRFVGAPLGPGTRVLDSGSGAAPGLRTFASQGVDAVGLDVAPAAVRAGRAFLPTARLVCADLSAPLPLRDETADLII